MAFPDDYHINEAPCLNHSRDHNWSTMGHPLKHCCVICHKVKWVHNPEPQKEYRVGDFIPHVNSFRI